MNDPCDFNRNSNLRRDRYGETRSSSAWIIAAVVILGLIAVAAYSYRGTQTASSGDTNTAGQSTRTNAPATPPGSPASPNR